MHFSPTLHGQANTQDARGCFSYSGYAIPFLCQSYPPQQWQFLWSGCLRTSAFWSEFELYFTDKCLNVLCPITWAFQLLWVSLVWKKKKKGYFLHLFVWAKQSWLMIHGTDHINFHALVPLWSGWGCTMSFLWLFLHGYKIQWVQKQWAEHPEHMSVLFAHWSLQKIFEGVD